MTEEVQRQHIRLLCVSSQVKSLLLGAEDTRDHWIQSLKEEVDARRPDFVAIHLQGLGTSAKDGEIEGLIKSLAEKVFSAFESYQIFSGRKGPEKSDQSLCSAYFVRNLKGVQLWNFKNKQFQAINLSNKQNYEGDLSKVEFISCIAVEKACMYTRWSFNQIPINFVNIYLPGDHSNLSVWQQDMSDSATKRVSILKDVIDKFGPTFKEEAIFFVGNVNCRLNMHWLMEEVSDKRKVVADKVLDTSGNVERIEYIDYETMKRGMTISDQSIDLKSSHDWLFNSCNGQLVRKFDTELTSFKNVLFEPPMRFSPSYPYQNEKGEMKNEIFQKTRCPAWPARVLSNQKDSYISSSLFYGLAGPNEHLGKHKPVYMSAVLSLV